MRACTKIVLAGLVWIVGCTSTLAGSGVPVTLAHVAGESELVLGRALEVRLTKGGKKELARGTRWRAVGTIPQGTVFKPVESVLLVRTDDNYEGFLVVAQDAVAGVYVPFEKLFIAAQEPVPIH